MAIGWKVPGDFTSNAIGFVSPADLPALPPGLERLHAFRKLIDLTRFNLADESQVLADASPGLSYAPSFIKANSLTDFVDMPFATRYSSGFTLAVSVAVEPNVQRTIARSGNFAGTNGWELRTRVDSGGSWLLQLRLYTASRSANVNIPISGVLGLTQHSLIFIRWTGSTARIDIPHASISELHTPSSGDSNPSPDPNAGIRFFRAGGTVSPGPQQNEISSWAAWDRELSTLEIADAYSALKSWAESRDMSFA